ncbi:MAG: NfeD family protein [Oscillospiraceae bacterium]
MPFGLTMTTFWLIVMVLFLAVEAVTVGLVCIWFAAGSLIALLAAMCGAPLWLQIVLFLVVSAATLYFTRPLVKRYVNSKVEPTNADMVIGKECRVTETVDNIAGTGAVYVDGKTWTARSENDEIIPEGTLVTAKSIDGVKLIVAAPEKETV